MNSSPAEATFGFLFAETIIIDSQRLTSEMVLYSFLNVIHPEIPSLGFICPWIYECKANTSRSDLRAYETIWNEIGDSYVFRAKLNSCTLFNKIRPNKRQDWINNNSTMVAHRAACI